MSRQLSPSELILNDDGSVYHLHLLPEHIADTVITVGDQNRAKRISGLFSSIDCDITNREFSTYSGLYKSKRITVCSTGIGTDNIDIFLNELDAAVNINLNERVVNKDHKSLDIIRIGTSGSVQSDVPVGSFVASQFGVGTDNLAYYYNYEFSPEEHRLNTKIRTLLRLSKGFSLPYTISCSNKLLSAIGRQMTKGITTTATGFYAPQGRSLRLKVEENFMKNLQSFKDGKLRITNLEMETSGLYTLSKLLGHDCLSCSAILANRADTTFADDPKQIVDNLIDQVLESL